MPRAAPVAWRGGLSFNFQKTFDTYYNTFFCNFVLAVPIQFFRNTAMEGAAVLAKWSRPCYMPGQRFMFQLFYLIF